MTISRAAMDIYYSILLCYPHSIVLTRKLMTVYIDFYRRQHCEHSLCTAEEEYECCHSTRPGPSRKRFFMSFINERRKRQLS